MSRRSSTRSTVLSALSPRSPATHEASWSVRSAQGYESLATSRFSLHARLAICNESVE